MHTYNVTDPDSGKSIQLQGESPPTEAELNDIFAQVHPSVGVDSAKGAWSGLLSGLNDLAHTPGNMMNMGAHGIAAVADYFKPGAGAMINTAADTVASIPGLPMLSGSASDSPVLDKIGGGYVPKTTAGQYAHTIGEFAPALIGGEAGTIPKLAKSFAGRVVAPALASETAGQVTSGTPYEGAARLAGGLVGGVPGLIGPSLGRVATRGANALTVAAGRAPLLDPAVQARSLLASALLKDGGHEAALATLRNFESSGASAPSLLDIGGNNVRRLLRTAASGDGEGQNLALNYADTVRSDLQDNALRHTLALTPANSDSATTLASDLERSRGSLAAEQYHAPYSQHAVVNKAMVSALQGPEGSGAIGRAFVAARANRNQQQMAELQDLWDVARNQKVTPDPLTGKIRSLPDALSELSAGSLDRVRIAMRDIGGSLAARGAKDIARGYAGRVNDIDTALDQTPGLADARGTYRGMSSAMDALDLGQKALNMPPAAYQAELAPLANAGGPVAYDAAAVGHRTAIQNAIANPASGQTGVLSKLATGTNPTQSLAGSFGIAPAARFQSALNNEIARLRNANFVSPNSGSQTQLRTADSAALSNIPMSKAELLGKALTWLKTGPLTAAERTEIVRGGLSRADRDALVSLLSGRKPVSSAVGTTSAAMLGALLSGGH